MTVSVDEAATKMVAAPAPVVLFDTCSLLDIVRAPIRADVPIKVVDEADRMVKESGTQLWIGVADLVVREFADNVAGVKQEVASTIQKLDLQLARMTSTAQVVNPVSAGRGHPSYVAMDLPDRLEKLASSLCANAIVLAPHNDFSLRASDRVVRRIPPAAKGQEFKDCVIIEHYLALCGALRQKGFAHAVVLVSSNKRDYCGADGKLHGSLAAEFGPIYLKWATDICWARSLLLN